ncbi:hypothetical protein OSB04_002887 [Centaurea solstitialis]|uniref:Hpc2-related domain-containing protein n=1 Tax=Centaurea solstitialis TaxID=347529 RepID=A0AA38U4A0_9ASTR|nr:hypothetical protein OSB04_002887 [Centaurea solstitialis]
MADAGGEGVAASSSSSTLLSGGGRQRFEVELRPGETTIVSWKKLIKDANKAAKNDNKPPPPPLLYKAYSEENSFIFSSTSRLFLPATSLITGGTAEDEANDAPLVAVLVLSLRRLNGKNSSDEEDLNDVPDDDEYDTEDSFIDDTELDEYFQVDNSAIKHDGFFVNRGKLERTNEPTVLPTEQPKKRRRKDSMKVSNDGNVPNKQMKVSKKEGRKVVASVDKDSVTPSRNITLPTANSEDVKYQSPIIALGTVVKKPSDPKTITDPSCPTKMLNGEARVVAKNIDKQKTGILQSKKHGTKLKDGSLSPALPSQRANDKGADVQLKSQGQLVNNSEELNQSVLSREKNVTHEQANIKASEIGQQPQKNTHTVRKEGSSAKPKSTSLLLEKAIRDLEKIVAETRPPSMEVPEADNSSQAVKRRMPPEIKQKLAKVARLAHAIHGKLTKELLNRLMNILGHLIQLRSLKRNLQNMVVMGLSAKEEKDARLQQLKKEVDEMVKIRAPLMKPEAIEQQAGSSDDFQEPSSKEKVLKSRFTTDDALEDKICEVYDLYVDGLEEDAGPQVRRLYAELAEMWPKGLMDNHGIKRAICRAKDRRKALHRRKEQEKLKRKKLLAPKTETLTVDGGGSVQHAPPDKVVSDSSVAVRSISNTIAAAEKPKQEKLKNPQNETTASEVLVKKKVKRKAEGESDDGQIRHEKSTSSAQGEERRKSHKQTTSAGPNKPATQPSIVTPLPASVTPATATAAAEPTTQPTANSSAEKP